MLYSYENETLLFQEYRLLPAVSLFKPAMLREVNYRADTFMKLLFG